jgi:hypothetical protein
MALRFKYLPSEYHVKFEHCVQNIKRKPALTIELAAAFHEQLQLLTDYIDCFMDHSVDFTVIHIVLDGFVSLTHHLSVTDSESLLSEMGMLRCYNEYAKSLLKINPDKGLQTLESAREYAILNEDHLMEFYGVYGNDVPYNPYSPMYLIMANEDQSIKESTMIEESIEYIILD